MRVDTPVGLGRRRPPRTPGSRARARPARHMHGTAQRKRDGQGVYSVGWGLVSVATFVIEVRHRRALRPGSTATAS